MYLNDMHLNTVIIYASTSSGWSGWWHRYVLMLSVHLSIHS